ncbi:MAG: Sir2 family NAD-dependent protein deacetylase [bacterium]
MRDPLDTAADWVAEARRPVAFSGAGASAESGIATFRDPGGIWERFDPELVGTPSGILSLLKSGPARLYGFLREALDSVLRAQPNPGHEALAALEGSGRLGGVITQNVDDLHQRAGSQQVVELHGNVFRLKCIECGRTEKIDRKTLAARLERAFSGDLSVKAIFDRLPRCEACGELVRLDVVLFGEAVQSLDEAYEMAGAADLMLVVGTSGMVYPAADLPHACRQGGGRIIVINPTENNFARLGGLFLQERSGVALRELANRVAARTGASS